MDSVPSPSPNAPLAVSVIIPTYNRAAFVVRAVDSVLSQRFADLEIIVVDDGSTDRTHDVLKAYGEKIRYFSQPNAGVGAARNAGIRRARGEWLAFLDSDDEWEADYLSRQIEYAGRNPGLEMQAANCLFVGSDGRTRSYFEINRSLAAFRGGDYLYFEHPFRFVVKHGPWQIGATMIRREAMMRAGLFDPALPISEDFDLMARVARLGSFGMIREPLMKVHRRAESTRSLTELARTNPIRAREVDGGIFEKLKTLPGLRPAERKALNELLSANRRTIGNLLLKDGRGKEARRYYRRAVALDPSAASIGKYLLSFFPGRLRRRIFPERD